MSAWQQRNHKEAKARRVRLMRQREIDAGKDVQTALRDLTREDMRAIVEASAWPCECPEGISLVCSAVPGAACTACKCKKWLEDGVKLSEGMK